MGEGAEEGEPRVVVACRRVGSCMHSLGPLPLLELVLYIPLTPLLPQYPHSHATPSSLSCTNGFERILLRHFDPRTRETWRASAYDLAFFAFGAALGFGGALNVSIVLSVCRRIVSQGFAAKDELESTAGIRAASSVLHAYHASAASQYHRREGAREDRKSVV